MFVDVSFFELCVDRCFEWFDHEFGLCLFRVIVSMSSDVGMVVWDEPESLILAQSERWRHA